jgi:hypothetical protein
MTESKPLPKFDSLDDLVAFFETRDLGDYLDQMPEAHLDIDLKKRTHIVAIDDDLAEKLDAIARTKHLPSERLINVWLREKILEQA